MLFIELKKKAKKKGRTQFLFNVRWTSGLEKKQNVENTRLRVAN